MSKVLRCENELNSEEDSASRFSHFQVRFELKLEKNTVDFLEGLSFFSH